MQVKKAVKTPTKEKKKTKRILEIVIPLKYFSNFWRILDMPFINCEVSLILTWSEIVF